MAEENNEPVNNSGEEPKNVETPKGEIKTEIPADKPVNKDAPIIPEGFDEELFDTENMSLRQDKIKERLSANKEEIAKWQKQAQDMRRKLSKGVETPENEAAYADQYVTPEEYVQYTEDKESPEAQFIDGSLKSIDKMALDNQFTVEQSRVVKDMYFSLLKDLQVLKSPEDKEKSTQELNKKMRESLGEEFKTVQKENQDFLTNYGVFDSEEKKMLIEASKTNPVVNTLVVKIRKLFDQTGIQIPIKANPIDNLGSDEALKAEYMDKNTTDERRIQILKQRAAAGRGKF